MRRQIPTIAIVLSTAFSLLSASARAGCPDFQTGRPSAASNSSLIADFDGDGRADIALRNGGIISIQRGNGDGTFGAPLNYSVGATGSVVISDFNNDGRKDIAFADGPASAGILLNNGGGAFAAAGSYGVGTSPQQLVAADFNGDGRNDLAAASSTSISILMNIGNAFGASVSYTVASTAFLTAGDFNGDGRADFVFVTTANNHGVLSFMFNNGDGTFAPVMNENQADLTMALGAADLNRDGRSDLVIRGYSAVTVRLGNSDRTFLAGTFYMTGISQISLGHQLALGDLNGDGNTDIVAGSTGSQDLSILIGNGDGTFKPEIRYLGSSSVYIADFNGDAKNDILASDILFGNGDGTFAGAFSVPLIDGVPRSIAVGDFNADGANDIAVVNGAGYTPGSNPPFFSIALGKGDGRFLPAVDYQSPPNYPYRLISGDFNGDGRSDLAMTTLNGSGIGKDGVNIYLSNPDGSVAGPTLFETGFGAEPLAAADFNGDRKLDLAVGNTGSAEISILLGAGNGTFAPAAPFTYTLPSGLKPESLAAGDFNGDGKIDLAAANVLPANEPGSVVWILIGNGSGAFAAPITYSLGAAPETVVTADFNGDGKFDLAVSKPSANTIALFLGRGDGTFNAAVDYPAGGQLPTGIAAADINGDGKSDVIAPISGGYAMSVLRGNDNGTLAAPISFKAGTQPNAIAAADFDGDGMIDLAVANKGAYPADPGWATGTIFLNRSSCASILSITPNSGPAAGGQSVVINGSSLIGAKRVTLGGTAAAINANTANSITVTTPPHSAGSVDVAVSTAGGPSTSLGGYTYISPCSNAIEVSPAIMYAGLVGSMYIETLTPRGGTAPYTMWIAGGVLPPGLTWSQNRLSGVPTTAGLFPCTVRVRDAAGCSSDFSYTIAISNPTCPDMRPGANIFVEFSGGSSGCDGVHESRCLTSEPIAFSLSVRGYDFFCLQHSFAWEFGDGQRGVGDHATHTYNQPGTYTVTLTISNARQQVHLSTNTVVVRPRRRSSKP
jgi:VCBS repeat protein/PKD domain-containing protein/IPT/TIG domain-containing protein/putative Ig domain-containing protein